MEGRDLHRVKVEDMKRGENKQRGVARGRG